jgi:hypothetical protein
MCRFVKVNGVVKIGTTTGFDAQTQLRFWLLTPHL